LRLVVVVPRLDDRFGVVLPLYHVRSPTRRALAVGGGRTIAHVIGLSTVETDPAPRHPLEDGVEGDLDGDDLIDATAQAGEGRVERLCLGDGPGEAVEDRASLRVRLLQPLLDEGEDELVRHELALAHELVELLPE